MLAAVLIFGFALAQIGQSGMHVGPRMQWALGVGGSAVGLAGLICLSILLALHVWADRVRQRLLDALAFLPPRYFGKLETLVTEFVQGALTTRQWPVLARMLLYTALEWFLIVCCYFCLFRAFSGLGGFRITDILIFMGFVTFGSVLQIPGVGGGMQLVSIIVLTELFRLPLELASSVAILVWVVTFVVIVPIGLLLLFREGLNWQKLKEMEAKAEV
jgi:hypothetical protein